MEVEKVGKAGEGRRRQIKGKGKWAEEGGFFPLIKKVFKSSQGFKSDSLVVDLAVSSKLQFTT